MRLVADENVDREVVERLRQAQHFVWYVLEEARGIRNGAVLAVARQQQAVLITADKDFGEIIFQQQVPFLGLVGVLLLRFSQAMSPDQKADSVAEFIAKSASLLPGKFIVLSQREVRIRPLPQMAADPEIEPEEA